MNAINKYSMYIIDATIVIALVQALLTKLGYMTIKGSYADISFMAVVGLLVATYCFVHNMPGNKDE